MTEKVTALYHNIRLLTNINEYDIMERLIKNAINLHFFRQLCPRQAWESFFSSNLAQAELFQEMVFLDTAAWKNKTAL